MRASLWALTGCAMLAIAARAEVEPVVVRIPEARAWIGQHVPFYVELRAPGSFVGTASFDLPQIPGVLLIKIGNPVVGSQAIAGESWFVQTHEFALFSQKSGLLELPAFPVRFARREGFVGPAKDVEAQAPGVKIEIRRPPGTEPLGFLVTAESMDVAESWTPAPGPSHVGALFRRTIVQRAPNVPGMALAPAPATAPAGIRIYPAAAQTSDRLERGDFVGERRETIDYLLQKPGTFTLPALAYVWWNPKTERLESKTLPGVTFDAAPAPAALAAGKQPATHRAWPWLAAAALIAGGAIRHARRLCQWGSQCGRWLNPPHRVAARKLLRACRRNDPAAAQSAWNTWRNMQNPRFQPSPDLNTAVLGLHRCLFGPAPGAEWQGGDLAGAFARNLAARTHSVRKPLPPLPYLNPTSCDS